MDEQIKLEPCPFCGSEAKGGTVIVTCTECLAEMMGATPDEAAAAWNRRQPAPAGDELERTRRNLYDLDKLSRARDMLTRIWELAERRASYLEIIEATAWGLGVNEKPAGDVLAGEALGDRLIAWAADEDSATRYDVTGQSHCLICGVVNGGYPGDDHAPDCLHVAARKLQERADE